MIYKKLITKTKKQTVMAIWVEKYMFIYLNLYNQVELSTNLFDETILYKYF